jgi:hypothetical protein
VSFVSRERTAAARANADSNSGSFGCWAKLACKWTIALTSYTGFSGYIGEGAIAIVVPKENSYRNR